MSLGSGWAPAVAALGDPVAVVPMAELPGFVPPTAAGHGGEVLSLRVGDHRVLVFVGRIHAYEGHELAQVVHPVRTACAAGVHTVVLTNAAGGLRDDFVVGQPVLINDHLNLTARSPLVGAAFVDLVDAYSPRLRAIAHEIDPSLAEGVYAGLPGPHYETPAEIRMLRTLGADLVGMSTVHETIAAREADAQVLAVSLVTNLAAGMTGQPLSHDDVLEAGRQSATRMGSLLGSVIAPALIAEPFTDPHDAAGKEGRREQHQQDPQHLGRDDERDVGPGFDRGRQDRVDAAGAGGQVALQRGESGESGQHHTEAGGRDGEREDEADRQRQHPPDRPQRFPGERQPGLPADQHVPGLHQHHRHREPERHPGDFERDGKGQRSEQPGALASGPACRPSPRQARSR